MNDTPLAANESRRRSIIAAVAILAAPAVLAAVLAIRPICSLDVGYHLAYGDHFLDTGRIVQTNRFIYTELRNDVLADPDQIGPGCSYDPATGTYHFVNANWLSQVIMAGAHRLGGMNALVVCQVVLVLGIVAVVAATMGRAGVAWPWVAMVVALAVIGASRRFNLRPELFGYLVMVGQFSLLVRRDFGWRSAAGVIALQVLAVNLHSYFLLGVAMAGAMFIDALARWLWVRWGGDSRPAPLQVARLKWLGVAGGGAVLACLVNPWFARGAIMPVHTLVFLQKYHILGRPADPADGFHPWAVIGELASPLRKAYFLAAAGKVYLLALVLAGVAAIVALLRRRWGAVLILAGMAAVSTGLQRNTAAAGLVILPLSFIILADGWRWLGRKLRWRVLRRLARWVGWIAGTATAVGAVFLIGRVVTNRFYLDEGLSWRFGGGASRLDLPVDAAKWINDVAKDKPLPGRIFTGCETSSNLLYLTRTRYEVPVLTNTWAIPSYVTQWVLQCTEGRRLFAPVADRYNINTVVLRSSKMKAPLMKALAADPDWAVVHLGPRYVVFLRLSGPAGQLARCHRITPKTLDLVRLAAEAADCDPVRAYALDEAATLLYRLAWGRGDRKMGGGDVRNPDEKLLDHEIAWAEKAAQLWRVAAQRDPQYRQATLRLANCLSLLGSARGLRLMCLLKKSELIQAEVARRLGLRDDEQIRWACALIPQYVDNEKQAERFRLAALASWNEAERLLADALRRDEQDSQFRQTLEKVRALRAAFQGGIIELPPIPRY